MQLKYNKAIYKKSALEKTAREFKHLAEFEINQIKNYYTVNVDKVDKNSAGLLADEFSNYVLYLMNT